MPIEHDVVTSVHRGGYVASSDPGAVGAYRFWTDTTTTPHVLKVRNAANTAWVLIGEVLTGSNVGTTGADVFKQKNGQVLEFRKIKGNVNVEVAQTANEVTVQVVESLLDKPQTQGYYLEDMIVTFISTSNPLVTATPISQFGGVTWTRTGTGTYEASFPVVLPTNGVITHITPHNRTGNPIRIFSAYQTSPNVILVESYDPATGALADVTGNAQITMKIVTTLPFLNQAAGFWGHWAPDSWFSGFDPGWDNKLNNPVAARLHNGATDVDQTGTLNSYPTVQFSSTTNDGRLLSQMAPSSAVIREIFVVMKMREATFSNYAGIITGPDTSISPPLVGDIGTTKFLDLSYTGQEYRLDGTLYANNNMQAPMNAWGIVHLRYPAGWGFIEVQFGKDRDFAGRFAEVDMAEVLMFSALQGDTAVEQIYEYLETKYAL
jgi:hypothetical protein